MFLILGQGFFCLGQTDTYIIDKPNSIISFNVKHLGVLTVEGVFKTFTATLEHKDDKIHKIENQISVKSIDTGNKKRDRILMEEAYLNAETFPFIHFTSNKITADSITGKLRILDVERTIAMPFHWAKPSINGNPVLVVSAVISRDYFNLDFGSMNAIIGNEIQVQLTLAFIPH